ncbi:hypothetical protein [Acinetobacter variabilis]|uniref:hypothetical protein n=1 Tax=Acinetobacter variabilis TaxID=70346 RepID=UPI0028A69EDF|nr:hypothetical protein [Acinetobacter variabilis]
MVKNKYCLIPFIIVAFSFFTYATEPVNNQSQFLIKIECDNNHRAWVKQLRFHNGIDTIQTAIIDDETVMCENGKFRVGNRLVSENYLTDIYGRMFSERKKNGSIPTQDPDGILSACNDLGSAKNYPTDADQLRHKELLQFCESYKKGL